jgi:thiol-disulfide isomerase/thioredoxin
MGFGRIVSRERFVLGVVGSVVTASVGAGPATAAGARTGPWCRELSKAAREELFDFSLLVLDGTADDVFSVSACQGKPIWLQLFASWCGPCNNEAADIVRIAKNYGEAIHVVGIDVKESPDKARAFRERHAIPFPIALDDTGSVFRTLGFKALPTHVFFDSLGRITCISVGDLKPDEMDNEIAVALSRSPQPGPT